MGDIELEPHEYKVGGRRRGIRPIGRRGKVFAYLVGAAPAVALGLAAVFPGSLWIAWTALGLIALPALVMLYLMIIYSDPE